MPGFDVSLWLGIAMPAKRVPLGSRTCRSADASDLGRDRGLLCPRLAHGYACGSRRRCASSNWPRHAPMPRSRSQGRRSRRQDNAKSFVRAEVGAPDDFSMVLVPCESLLLAFRLAGERFGARRRGRDGLRVRGEQRRMGKLDRFDVARRDDHARADADFVEQLLRKAKGHPHAAVRGRRPASR